MAGLFPVDLEYEAGGNPISYSFAIEFEKRNYGECFRALKAALKVVSNDTLLRTFIGTSEFNIDSYSPDRETHERNYKFRYFGQFVFVLFSKNMRCDPYKLREYIGHIAVELNLLRA